MSRSVLELDFFRMEKEVSPNPQPKKLFDRRRSFRDIQSVVSKLNPELLKTVIATGSVDHNSSYAPKSSENGKLWASKSSFSVPSTPKLDASCLFPASGSNGCGSEQGTPETTPLTIFYKGAVAVFDVPQHKAENILKLAEEQVPKSSADNLDEDLPIARKRSLQRFMEKRKERLTLVSPYGCPVHSPFSGKN